VRGSSVARLLAIAAFAVAFVGLDRSATRSFSAHMTQHMAIVVVLAPLLVIGWRPHEAPRWMRGAAFAGAAAAGQIAALAIWHIPVIFDEAEAHVPLHAFEHLTLLVTATAAWWVILASPVGTATRFAVCVAVAGPMLLVGVWLTLTSTLWYSAYATHLTDQQVGGAIMWGPAGLAYVVAAGWLVGHAIVEDERLTLARRG
jgi:putative membrane protein